MPNRIRVDQRLGCAGGRLEEYESRSYGLTTDRQIETVAMLCGVYFDTKCGLQVHNMRRACGNVMRQTWYKQYILESMTRYVSLGDRSCDESQRGSYRSTAMQLDIEVMGARHR